MTEYAFETSSLSKKFGRKSALSDLSLKVELGGVHAIVGSNGAGKSTLFRILLGLLNPSSGSSRVLGMDSQSLTPELRGRIGLVSEEHTLPRWMSVASLKAMQQDLYPRWSEGVYRQVLGHFNVHSDQKVSQLSRGERAGLSLALALAQSPDLLFLDEPTLGLDVVAKQAVLDSILFAGEDESTTIVYCSHQMDEIERVADDLIILEQGELRNASLLDEFCDRITGWTVEAPSPLAARDIPGLLQARYIEGRQHLVVLDQDGDVFPELLESRGATSVMRMPLGFDRAVNAYLTRNHRKPVN